MESLKPVIDKLEKLFSKFNDRFYGGELQTPVITVSPDTTKGAYGWCTSWKAWKEADSEDKAKLEAFADLLESTGDRLIVFYNFTAELEAMQKIAKSQERPFSIVNGSVKDLKAYEENDDSVTFVQYQAGAMGLNLQKANKTVYFTLPFGKGSCDIWQQSKKRTHRIGQANKCFYYYLLCKDSIEEKNLINLRLGKEYDDYLFEKEYS